MKRTRRSSTQGVVRGASAGGVLSGLDYLSAAAESRLAQVGAPAAAGLECREDDDPHLRSCKEVLTYHIHATDGDIGHVHGMLVEEETWAIRYLIVETSSWWLGHQVLIAPQWIQEVSWPDAKVSVNLTRQAVQAAPPYDPAAQLARKQEVDIYRHYDRAGYWTDEMKHPAVAH